MNFLAGISTSILSYVYDSKQSSKYRNYGPGFSVSVCLREFASAMSLKP